MRRALATLLALAAVCALNAATKVGGTGATKVGGTGATKVGVVSAYTLKDQYVTSPGSAKKVGSAVGNKYAGEYIRAGTEGAGGAGYNVVRVVWKMRRTATMSPDFNVTMSIRTNVANLPNTTALVASSTTFAASTLTTSFADKEFLFSSTALTNNTVYWFIIECSGTNDTNNCIEIQDVTNVPSDNFARTYYRFSPDGSDWTAAGENTMRYIQTYAP